MRRILARWLVPVVGTAALIEGAVLAARTDASFGWFAYAPLSAIAFFPLSQDRLAGLILLGVGLVLIAGWAGFWLGRLSRGRA